MLAEAPPEAAAAWCDQISGTPHFACRLKIMELLAWRGRVVRYAREIDCLRGLDEACKPYDGREERACWSWLPFICPGLRQPHGG